MDELPVDVKDEIAALRASMKDLNRRVDEASNTLVDLDARITRLERGYP